MIKKSILLSAVLAGGMLGFPVNAQRHSQEENVVVMSPELGKEVTVSAGENIWVKEVTPVRTSIATAIKIRERIRIGNLMKGQVTIPISSEFKEVDTEVGLMACTKLNMAWGRNKPCLIDEDMDGLFEKISFKQGEDAAALGEPVAYYREELDSNVSVGKSFKSVLIYNGSNSSTLLIGYREFSDDMARPAFTEELQIPIKSEFPQGIRVKGVTININSIDGMGMNYKITNNPDN